MNGIEGIGGAGPVSRALHITHTPDPPMRPDVRPPEEENNGLDGAMQMFRQFTRQAVCGAGFIDFEAGTNEKFRALFEQGLTYKLRIETRLDPTTEAEVAAYAGGPVTKDINLALRILSHVDPARVAALLK